MVDHRALVILLLMCVSPAPLAAQESKAELLRQVQETCSGADEIIAKNGTGSITFKDFKLEFEAGKDVEVRQKGVLLRRVKEFDYNKCISELRELLNGKQGSSLPTDILNKVRLGEFGKTTIQYVKSFLGTPQYETEHRAQYELDGYVLEFKYLGKSSVDGPKGLITGMKVSIIPSFEGSRKRIMLNNYYPGFDPKLELGKSKVHEFPEECDPSYMGGVAFNKDRTYYCAYPSYNSTGWVAYILYIEGSDELGILYSCTRMINHYDKVSNEAHVKKHPDQKYLLYDWRYYDVPEDEAAIKETESECGLLGQSNEAKAEAARAKIKAFVRDYTVTGIQIYVDGGNLDEEDGSDDSK